MRIEALYDAAARAGLLVEARWMPAGQPDVVTQVDFRAPDETVLDGFALATDYTIRYPALRLPGLGAGETVEVAGSLYRVREVRALGDGTEMRASLSRL